MARTAHLRPAGSPHPGPRLRRALVGALVALLVVPVVATADPLPTDPSVSGGSLAWTSAASVTLTASGSTWLGGPVDGYESRVSADGGATWSLPVPGATAGVSAEGESLVEFRSVAAGGLAVSAWAPDPATAASTVRIDRTAPAGLVVSGGSLSWQSVGGIAIGAGGAVDTSAGLAAYERRISTDGGATWTPAVGASAYTATAEGQTLVQYRAVDVAGNATAWTPSHSPAPAAEGTARIDVTDPTAPTVSGGSLTWQSVAAVTFTATGGTDGGGGVAGYQHRTSTNGGVSFGPVTAGASVDVTAEGETVVQFRSVDAAGNLSDWAPVSPTAATTARIDRTGPTGTSVSGGSTAWDSVPSMRVTAAGASDGSAGFAGYQARTSTDDGVTWGAPASASFVDVTAEGQTLVQFRALDLAGNASAWAPASPTNGSTVRIDRTAPSDPAATGGGLAWQPAASVTVSATGAVDAGGSGLAGHQFRTSTNGGVSWSSSFSGASTAIGAEGETLVQFRAIDAAGNASGWAPAAGTAGATVRLDRSGPVGISVTGGATAWQSIPGVTIAASGASDDSSGVAGYEHRTSTDGGTTWSAPAPGTSADVTAEGETWVQFRAVDGVGNASAWTPGTQTSGSLARIDRTAPSLPTVTGGSPVWSSDSSVTVTGAGSTDSGGSDLAGYQYRLSTNGGSTWGSTTSGAHALVGAEGVSIVEFRAVDNAGNVSDWAPSSPTDDSTVKLDRTGPVGTTVSGGASAWQNVASVTVSAAGASDDASGLGSYQYRTSADGVAWSAPAAGASLGVSAEGETYVQFRALDAAGNPSSWAPSFPTSGNTVRIDRTAPTAPSVNGGSLAWQAEPWVPVSASGATDPGGSGVAAHQYRTSTDDGQTWTSAIAGNLVNVTQEGASIVQFRALDEAGNVSAWAPALPNAASTVKLDRNAPTGLVYAGGSSTWLSQASATVTASGATDGAGSGLTGYQHRTSADGGASWTAPAAGPAAAVTAEGETFTQFRALDAAGNATEWTPSFANSSSIVRLDRTAPTTPTATGGSLSWQDAPFVTVNGGGSSDLVSGVTGFEKRTSTDGGTTWSAPAPGQSATATAEGETMVQFRATDGAGNASAWGPAAGAAGATARLDRNAPTDPTGLTGGSLTWVASPSVTLTPSGGTDDGSGVTGYQFRVSQTGGSSWGPSGAAPVAVTGEGESVVQVRTVDAAGNVSGWFPATPSAATTVRLDRTGPAGVSVTGGSLGWQSVPSVGLSASGAVDAVVSVAGYESRSSTDGGATWSAPAAGASLTVTGEGETLVQFRALDTLGNAGPWVPAHAPGPSASGTARIDRTPPSTPGGLSAQSPTATAPVVSWTAVSGATTYRVLRDGVAAGTTSSASFTDTGASGGIIQYRVVAIDAAGNESGASAALPVDYRPGADLVAPETTITAAPPSETNDVTPDLRFADDGTGAGFECRVDGGAWIACTSPFTPGPLAEGAHSVDVRAYDAAANVDATPAHASFVVDTTAPVAPGAPLIGAPPTLSWPAVPGAGAYEVGEDGTAIVRTPTADALMSGLADITAPLAPSGLSVRDAGADALSVSWSAVDDRGTEHRVAVRAVDAAGNASAWSPATTMTVTAGMGAYRVSIDGHAPVETATPSVRLASAGVARAHRITVTAVDRAGNASAAADVDWAPGGVTTSPGAPGGVRIVAPRFARPGAAVVLRLAVTGAIPSAVRWSIPGVSPATGPRVTVRFRRAGRQAVSVRATGLGGKPIAASAVIVVDGTRPSVATRVTGRSLRVKVADRGGSGVAAAKVRVGAGPWTKVGAAPLALPPGVATVEVQASDRAGNRVVAKLTA